MPESKWPKSLQIEYEKCHSNKNKLKDIEVKFYKKLHKRQIMKNIPIIQDYFLSTCRKKKLKTIHILIVFYKGIESE